MTLGASTMPDLATAAITPLAVTMNLRRSVVIAPSSPRHELVIGTLGHVVPRANERPELHERRMDFSRHGGFLGLFLHNLRRNLLQVAQHRNREGEDLDLAPELRPETFQRDGILGVVVREGVNLDSGRRVIEYPPEVDGESLVRLPVKAKPEHGARVLPARIVVIARGLVQTQFHVIVRANPFGRIDDAPFESS